MEVSHALGPHYNYTYFLVCVGEYVGGKTQPTLLSMLSAVKEENQYKGKKSSKYVKMHHCMALSKEGVCAVLI